MQDLNNRRHNILQKYTLWLRKRNRGQSQMRWGGDLKIIEGLQKAYRILTEEKWGGQGVDGEAGTGTMPYSDDDDGEM